MPKVPKEPAAFLHDGVNVVLDSAAVYADSHPWVKAHPELFRDHDPVVLEAATAAPGEVRRGPGRPRKSA